MKKIAFFFAMCATWIVNADGNYELGQQKAVVCAACHGSKGVSTNPLWPNLAGQHTRYFVKQLQDFKQKQAREAESMTPMVASLSDQDMLDLAVFYAKQPLPEGVTPARYVKRGEQLYRGGDFNKHITACIACHGPKGTGNAQAGFPLLSGQHAEYTIQQLQSFKDKKRKNDLNGIMQDICGRMDLSDMEAVAHYIAGLHGADY